MGRSGRTGGQFLPSPRSLFVPYFSILPSPSPFFPSCPTLSVPYSRLSVPYPFPIRSLFSSRNPHVFPPGPAFVPPFTRFHTHFPTRVSLSVCASVPRHPCVCIMICPYTPGYALADLGGSPYGRLDVRLGPHPGTQLRARLPAPGCPSGCMPSRMDSHMPPHASAPAHLGVHISVHMDVCLDVRLGIYQGVHMDASLGVHWGVY